MFGLGNQVHIERGKFYSVTYPASTDVISIVTQMHCLSQKAANTVKFSIGQFPFVLSNDIVMHLVCHFNLSTLI